METLTTRTFGIIGWPLTHSFSPTYFAQKFEREGIEHTVYNKYPLQSIDELGTLKSGIPGLAGLNVTIPYKSAVIPYLDELSEEAQQIGAVNTIRISDGKWKGFNTDVFGFEQSLLAEFLPDSQFRALILGTGGAAKAAAFIVRKWGLDLKFVSRNPQGKNEIHYSDLSKSLLSQCQLIIQTTPLGMNPNLESCPPIPFQYLNEQHFLFDMVYNPEKTIFLRQGSERGCSVMNGEKMLYLQAEKAWEIWNN